jgi:hypothetical protein
MFRTPTIGDLKGKSSRAVGHDGETREGEAPAEPPGTKVEGPAGASPSHKRSNANENDAL